MHLNGHGLVFRVCPYRQGGRVTAVTLMDTATRTEGWSAPRLTYIHTYIQTDIHTYTHTYTRTYVTTVKLICTVPPNLLAC
jgi:hypothetical protein